MNDAHTTRPATCLGSIAVALVAGALADGAAFVRR